MQNKIIISFFDNSGIWSLPYRLAGYIVIQVESKLGLPLSNFLYTYIDKSRVHGILAAPPCVDFTKAGSSTWNKKDVSGETQKSVKLVLNVLEIVEYFNPSFWVLENPPGRLEKLIPLLKKYRLLSFQPYYYNDPYSKYTILYGKFNPFLTQSPVPRNNPSSKGVMSIDHFLIHDQLKVVPRLKRNEFRSITPVGFSKAFFQANP